MIERQRFDVERVEPRAGELAAAESRHQRGLIDNWAARGVDQERGRLHQREVLSADEAARALAELEMDREEIRLPEQILLRDERGAAGPRLFVGEVLAPG